MSVLPGGRLLPRRYRLDAMLAGLLLYGRCLIMQRLPCRQILRRRFVWVHRLPGWHILPRRDVRKGLRGWHGPRSDRPVVLQHLPRW